MDDAPGETAGSDDLTSPAPEAVAKAIRQRPFIGFALALKRMGHDPIPVKGKKGGTAWPSLPNMEADIVDWHGRSAGVRVSGGLLVIDLDTITDGERDAVLAALTKRWPDFMSKCVQRHSQGASLALFGRTDPSVGYSATGHWGPADSDRKGSRIEVWGSRPHPIKGTPRRLFVAWGEHSRDRAYGYHGRALYEVKFEDLPEFEASEIPELLEICTHALEDLGLVLRPDVAARARAELGVSPGRTNEEIAEFLDQPGRRKMAPKHVERDREHGRQGLERRRDLRGDRAVLRSGLG